MEAGAAWRNSDPPLTEALSMRHWTFCSGRRRSTLPGCGVRLRRLPISRMRCNIRASAASWLADVEECIASRSAHSQGRRSGGDQLFALRQEKPYCVRMAHHNKASTLVITDSQMSPSTRFATALLTVKEGNAFGFRSLTNTMCLCQALFIALAYKLELNIEQLEEGFRRSAVIARPAFSPIDFRSRKLLVSR